MLPVTIPSSTQGKDNRREEMKVIVLFYRANLPYSVETCPWCLRIQGLPKPLEDLQLLLLTEHRLASGQTLELENEFGFLTTKLVLDLGCHPIDARGDLLLVSTREPYTRALRDFRLYDNGAVCHPQRRYASDDELFVLHVAGSPETQGKRNSITHPVAVLD